MKIASFDIGIKNLAVCVLDSETKEIIHWTVINTIDPDLVSHYCNKCGKSATVSTLENTLFDTCNKNSDIKDTILKDTEKKDTENNTKIDNTEVNEIETEVNDTDNTENEIEVTEIKVKETKESELKETWWCLVHDPLKKTRDKKEIEKLKKKKAGKKVKSCTTQELNIKTIIALDKLQEILLDVDEVIIELQPRLNPKMKQISQTVYSYFLIRGAVDKNRIRKVCFVSATKKLKIAAKLYNGPQITCKLSGKYAQRKYYSKEYTKWLLKENEYACSVMAEFKSKIDDLCDCYLQGIWYIYR